MKRKEWLRSEMAFVCKPFFKHRKVRDDGYAWDSLDAKGFEALMRGWDEGDPSAIKSVSELLTRANVTVSFLEDKAAALYIAHAAKERNLELRELQRYRACVFEELKRKAILAEQETLSSMTTQTTAAADSSKAA